MRPKPENLLAALCPTQKENFCSDLLRWCLLNHAEFRTAFLNEVAEVAKAEKFYASEAIEVKREHRIGKKKGEEGRLDLHIKPKGSSLKWLVVIEVKVTAPLADGQAAKYRNWAAAGGYALSRFITLTRASDCLSEAHGHLSWTRVHYLLVKTVPLDPLVKEILTFFETEVLPMKMRKLNPNTLKHYDAVRQFEEELKAFLRELRQRQPFDSHFASKQPASDPDNASNGILWVGLYQWKKCPETQEELVELYVGFKIDSEEQKMSLFIQRQFGADEYSEQLKKHFKTNDDWEVKENYESARLNVQLEEEVKIGEDRDGKPEAMVKWFKEKTDQAFPPQVIR